MKTLNHSVLLPLGEMKVTTACAKNTRRDREREREEEKERKREKKKSSFFSRGGGVANRSSSLRASKRESLERENIHFCNNNNNNNEKG